jgi:hypothetical protein
LIAILWQPISCIKGHAAVEAARLILDAVITASSVQDRRRARPLPWKTHRGGAGRT